MNRQIWRHPRNTLGFTCDWGMTGGHVGGLDLGLALVYGGLAIAVHEFASLVTGGSWYQVPVLRRHTGRFVGGSAAAWIAATSSGSKAGA